MPVAFAPQYILLLLRKAAGYHDPVMNAQSKPTAILLTYGDAGSWKALQVLDRERMDIRLLAFESSFFRNDIRHIGELFPGLRLDALDFTPELSAVLQRQMASPAPLLSQVCVECRAAMLRAAGEFAAREGIDYIITGDTCSPGDRLRTPGVFHLIDEKSGQEGKVLRPLCHPARNPETGDPSSAPEAWAAAFPAARSLMPLARRPNCRLRDPSYFSRAWDLYLYGGPLSRRDIELLAVGRHFRLTEHARLVVGRNQEENLLIEGSRGLYELLIKVENFPGPSAVLSYTASPGEVRLAAAICARYADLPGHVEVSVRVRSAREAWRVRASPAPDSLCRQLAVRVWPELCDRRA